MRNIPSAGLNPSAAQTASSTARPCEPRPQRSALLQRILLNGQHATDVVVGSRIGTSSLRKGALFHAPAMEQPGQAIVSLDAARLVINSVLLLALPSEFLLGSPWLRPHGRIFDRNLVCEGLRVGARPPLDQVQVLARPLKIGFRAEVGHVDHERVALPMTTRVAEPLADVGRQVGAPVHNNIALPPLALIHVVEDRDAAGGLHDSAKAAAEQAAK